MTITKATLSLAITSLLAAGLGAQRGRGGAPSQPTAPTPPGPPHVEALKKEAAADVESMRVMTQQMVDQVFSYGELGFQEFETSKYLTGILEKNGFKIERQYAGIPTAWMATWGSGKPVIAIGSDIDCIPQASQKPGVAYHDPLLDGAPGHGEGHNTGVPLNITAVLAVKKREAAGHAEGVAGRGRRARRRESVFHSRRPVPRRGHLAVRARRHQPRRELGRRLRHRAGLGRVQLHR